MDYKLIWTESAIDDLGAIVRYLANHGGKDIAAQIGTGIYDRAQILMTFPEIGSRLHEKDDPRWRKLIFKSWKIAYRIDAHDRTVYVARIWHASRNEIEIE